MSEASNVRPGEEEMGSSKIIPIAFELTGFCAKKRRNEVNAGMIEPYKLRSWDLVSDEAPFHGGDESAPQPIVLFMAGIVTCFMTQMRTFAKQCGVSVENLKISSRFEWQAEQAGKEPYTAHPVGGIIELRFDDVSSSLEEQKKLIRTATQSCFAEQMLCIKVKHRLWHDGIWVECDEKAAAELI